MLKHTKLKVTKREKPAPRPRSNKFYPKKPITKGKFIKQISTIKDEQNFKIKDHEETVFVIEKYDKASISEIVKTVEKRWKGMILLFLTESEFLVRVSKPQLVSIIEIFNNRDKDIYAYIKNTIKSIRPLVWDQKISKDLKIKFEKTSSSLKITGLIVPGFSENEYKDIINGLKKEYSDLNIQESSYKTSSLLTFQALIDKKSLKNIANLPYVYLLSEPPNIIFNRIDSNFDSNIKQVNHPKIDNSDDKPIVCVIDSGIHPTSLQNCISILDGHPTLKGDFKDLSNGHGTEVCSIAAYGDELVYSNKQENNLCEIISYKLADININVIVVGVLTIFLMYKFYMTNDILFIVINFIIFWFGINYHFKKSYM